MIKFLLILILAILIIVGLERMLNRDPGLPVISAASHQSTVISNVSDGDTVPAIDGYATGVPVKYRERFLLC